MMRPPQEELVEQGFKTEQGEAHTPFGIDDDQRR